MKENFDFSGYAEFVSRTPFEFSTHSSIGCGGSAKIAFYPRNDEEMQKLINRLREDGFAYRALGNLTNVLPPDEGFDQVVVSGKKLNKIVVGKEIFISAGVSSGTILSVCKRARKSGVEFLRGIPCTLGGALYMNAGVAGRYTAEVVDKVLLLREGKRIILSQAECRYSYKKSTFMNGKDVILGAWLRLVDSDEEKIEREEKYYENRRAHLPKGKSMGCVFKNPDGYYAGELIERSGLKGFRVGGAKISQAHANFIINEGGATAKEIRAVIEIVKNAVYAQYGVRLEEEIEYL